MNILNRLFGYETSDSGHRKTSKNVAKDRLKLALTYDRGDLAHGTIEQLRDEILQVITKYLTVSNEEIDIHFDRSADYDKLVASIPLRVTSRARSAKGTATTSSSPTETPRPASTPLSDN